MNGAKANDALPVEHNRVPKRRPTATRLYARVLRLRLPLTAYRLPLTLC